ncbi:MAG: hypothetical protein JNK76_19115 [Planctomycetales bacterium]|nr:hypothetical protein [Planctomycetales bacterium]
MNVKLAVAALAAIALCGSIARAEIKVLPSPDNYIVKKLPGRWEVDPELTKRLGGKEIGPLEFVEDVKAVDKIPADYHQDLVEFEVYQIGFVTREGKQHPYLLVEIEGLVGVVYFLGKGGDFLDDFGVISIALVPAKDTADDLLFLGDNETSPFAGYRREGADKVSAALQRPMTLEFDRNDLRRILELISDKIEVPIEMVDRDFAEAGITKNQSMSLHEANRPAGEILRIVLEKASPGGQLVYVVKPDRNNDGRETVFICTRKGTLSRGEKLPAVFDRPPPLQSPTSTTPLKDGPGNPFGRGNGS